jgi:hypothetical protein
MSKTDESQTLKREISLSILLALSFLISFGYLLSRLPNGLADAEPMIQAFGTMNFGLDPYIANQHIGAGPLGIFFIGITLGQVSVGFAPLFWHVANALGFMIFIRSLGFYSSIQQFITLIFPCLFLAPVRESLVNNQITGLALGFLGLGVIGTQSPGYFQLLSLRVLSSASLILSFALKPNLVFFALLILLIKSKKTIFFDLAVTFILMNLTLTAVTRLDVWSLHKSWLTQLLEFGLTKSSSLETHSIYKLLPANSVGLILKLTISMSFFLILALIAVKYRKNWSLLYFLAFIPPLFLNYVHLLDASAICICILSGLISIQNRAVIFSALFMLIISESDKVQNVVFLAGTLIAISVALRIFFEFEGNALGLKTVFFNVTLYALVQLLNNFLEGKVANVQSLQILEIALLSMIYVRSIIVKERLVLNA